MNTTEWMSQILLYAMPALMVLIAIKLLGDQQRKRLQLQKQGNWLEAKSKNYLPTLLTAHERAILFLERIAPTSLLLRVTPTGKNMDTLRRELLFEIRSEYEHNIAQQLYVSDGSWTELVQAKEAIVSLILKASEGLEPEDEAKLLSRKILEMNSQIENNLGQKAIFLLKKDVQSRFAD